MEAGWEKGKRLEIIYKEVMLTLAFIECKPQRHIFCGENRA